MQRISEYADSDRKKRFFNNQNLFFVIPGNFIYAASKTVSTCYVEVPDIFERKMKKKQNFWNRIAKDLIGRNRMNYITIYERRYRDKREHARRLCREIDPCLEFMLIFHYIFESE